MTTRLSLLVFTLSILGSCLMSTELTADETSDKYEKRVFKDSAGLELPYRIYVPEGGKGPLPILYFLHGAGERGTNNETTLVHGARDFVSEKVQKNPCVIVIPQCPEGMRWVEVDWSLDAHDQPEEMSKPMHALVELIASLEKELPIDTKREYLTGLSMGGFGTWDLLMRKPDHFAAAIAICGGSDTNPTLAKKISHVPVWVFHGDQDTAVKVSRSREIVKALEAAGGRPKYTEYPGVGHDSWSATYRNPEVYEWLFKQSKN